MARRIHLRFSGADELEREHDTRLCNGEALVTGVTGLDALMPCELVLHHPDGGEPLTVAATVIATQDQQERDGGARMMLDQGQEPELRAFVSRRSASQPPAQEDDQSRAVSPEKRLRRLSMPEQIKLARTSSIVTERQILERMLGKPGWDQLLRNPRITTPEIARIARKGTVPRPLLELIIQNRRWLEAPMVRRALLTNPKLTHEMIRRVLRATPGNELKLVPRQTAYPRAVRAVASKLLGNK